jgi:hypothetical protein
MFDIVLRNKITAITGLLFALCQLVLTFKPLPFHLTIDQMQWVSFLSMVIFIVHSTFTKDATGKDGTISNMLPLPPILPIKTPMELTQNADLTGTKAP